MRRVVSLATLFPSPARPAFGGFVARQMQALALRGDVDVVVINPLGIPPWPLSLREPYRSLAGVAEVSVMNGLTVHHPRFRAIPRFGADSNPARIAAAVLPLVRRLHRERPFDLVDAQFFFPDGPAAARIAAELGLPLSIKARGSDIHYWSTRPGALGQMLAAADQATGMLAVSNALRCDMAALGMSKARIAVHYTGLDHARFRVIQRHIARAAIAADPGIGIPGDGPLLVTPGAMIPVKGQRLAIEALAHLPTSRLALAGTGGDEMDLRALAAKLGLTKRVHFLGQVSHEILPTVLCAADVVVLPSQREGLANVWIEALACGAPLVIPDVGGAREVVHDASAGRLVPRDPQAIAVAVRALLANPPEQTTVAANAARFDWATNAAQLAEHYHRLADRA